MDWRRFKTGKYYIQMGKPLIISFHRLNYIGFIDETNRSRNLLLLKQLLKLLTERWPDVEFMSSDKLGRLILNEE